jgi:hypothetical protein
VNALNNVLADYKSGKIQFHSEHDLLCNIFSECKKLMQSQNFPMPLKLYAQKDVSSCYGRRSKVDLVLGDDEVLVEFKVEPVYVGVNWPVVFDTKKQGASSIEGDIDKAKNYCNKDKCGHFVMVDEDGRHSKKNPTYLPITNWKPTGKNNIKGTPVQYVHIDCRGAYQ